jgi:hypothetical protein
VLPGGQNQCAGGYSSHRGMSRYGDNTQMYVADIIYYTEYNHIVYLLIHNIHYHYHRSQWQQRATRRTGTQGVEGRRKSADLKRPPRLALRR